MTTQNVTVAKLSNEEIVIAQPVDPNIYKEVKKSSEENRHRVLTLEERKKTFAYIITHMPDLTKSEEEEENPDLKPERKISDHVFHFEEDELMTSSEMERILNYDPNKMVDSINGSAYLSNSSSDSENECDKSKLSKSNPPHLLLKSKDNHITNVSNKSPAHSMKKKLNEIEVYKCEYCIGLFETEEELNHHNMKRCVKIYKCNLCDKGFKDRRDLERHRNNKKPCLTIKENLEDEYVCKICNKGYTALSSLTTHKKSCIIKNNKDRIQSRKIEQDKREIEELLRIREFQMSIFEKYKNIKVEKSAKKSENIVDILKDMNGRNNTNLINFSLFELSLRKIKERLKEKDLLCISDMFHKGNDKKLAEYVLTKIHYSVDYDQGHNIKYIPSSEKYIIYRKNVWSSKLREKEILEILQKEVEWGIYQSVILTEMHGNKLLAKQLLDKYNKYVKKEHKIVQTEMINKIQKKYEKIIKTNK